MKRVPQTSAISCRKFALSDAMIVVAAMAVSAHLLKLHYSQLLIHNAFDINNGSLAPLSEKWLLSYSVFVTGWTFCWLLPCSWGFVVIRLRRPRPRPRRMFRQPGMAAIALTSFFTLVVGIMYIIRNFLFIPSTTNLFIGYRLETLLADGGLMALSAWIILPLTGRCRPERGWIDPMGRVLGACWITSWIIHYITIVWYVG
jgi:hypothetical protein